MSDPIEDKALILWLKNNYKEIEFIKHLPDYQRVDRLERISKNIEKLKTTQQLYSQKDLLIEIWKDLVAMAVIYLKSKDKREKFHDDGDYGIDDLGNFFQKYCDFEKILYGSGEYYRDHVSHVFKVFILGEKFVNENLDYGFSSIELNDSKLMQTNLIQSDGETDTKFLQRQQEKLITANEKEAMWCIASLTHDLGYPTEVVNDIHDNLRDMLTIFNIKDVSYILSQQSQKFNDSIIKLISSDLILESKPEDEPQYITHTQAKYYFKYSRSIEKWDHGVESCIVLVKSLVYFLETDYSIDERKLLDIDDARQFLIRQGILRAIASHNCDFIYHLKLDFSFLLRIIDEMQEWGRPSLKDLFTKTPDFGFSIDKFTQKEIEYTITFSNNTENPDAVNKNELHHDIKEYFKRCVNKYIKILRSAVFGNVRDGKLVLTVNIVDETESDIKYKFVHINPTDIKMSLVSNELSYNNPTPIKLMEVNESIELVQLDERNWTDFCKTLKNEEK